MSKMYHKLISNHFLSKTLALALSIALLLSNAANAASETQPQTVKSAITYTCPASSDWVTNPNPPSKIPGGGTDFCQFYQFAWQWFLYLMSPSASDASVRNF